MIYTAAGQECILALTRGADTQVQCSNMHDKPCTGCCAATWCQGWLCKAAVTCTLSHSATQMQDSLLRAELKTSTSLYLIMASSTQDKHSWHALNDLVQLRVLCCPDQHTVEAGQFRNSPEGLNKGTLVFTWAWSTTIKHCMHLSCIDQCSWLQGIWYTQLSKWVPAEVESGRFWHQMPELGSV